MDNEAHTASLCMRVLYNEAHTASLCMWWVYNEAHTASLGMVVGTSAHSPPFLPWW